MKKKNHVFCFLVGLITTASLICPMFAVAPFPDVDENAEYAEALQVLYDMDIMRGDSEGNFNPDSEVTRSQMAVIICKVLGETENLPNSGTPFSDMPVSHWASAFVAKAVSLGIISGYTDGTFRPDNTVTYEEALTMIVRTMGLTDYAIEAGGYPDGYIEVASEYGVAGGFEAKQGDILKRWQVAEIVFGIFL